MEFKEQLPVWKAEGVAPPETKQNEGWKIGDKPPADWFNYMWSRTYYSLDEIREKIKLINKDVAAAGKVDTVNSVKPDSKKNIELTGSNIKYKTGASENIGVKIDILNKEVDTVKQSGVESNKILVDALNSKKVQASTSDTIKVNVNKVKDIKLGSGNAVTSDVLEGKTFSSSQGTDLTGAMPNNGVLSKTITTQGGTQKISPGYYEGGEVKAQFNNLVPQNIKKGINVGGVVGNIITAPTMESYSSNSNTTFTMEEIDQTIVAGDKTSNLLLYKAIGGDKNYELRSAIFIGNMWGSPSRDVELQIWGERGTSSSTLMSATLPSDGACQINHFLSTSRVIVGSSRDDLSIIGTTTGSNNQGYAYRNSVQNQGMKTYDMYLRVSPDHPSNYRVKIKGLIYRIYNKSNS